MDVALCYESVIPARGGCQTYITDLARRLAKDGHAVHLYAREWDAAALPVSTHCHRVNPPKGPRFLRPWRFAAACETALAGGRHDVTVGFDKTWGQDVLYPQGGLHVATVYHNALKFRNPVARAAARIAKRLDPAAISFSRLERKQYLGPRRPLIVANSRMVRDHFEHYYGVPTDSIRVIPNAIDPLRFAADDRPKRRLTERTVWGITPDEPVGLFVATNYRLKGLAPLLRAVATLPANRRFSLAVIGHTNVEPYRRLARRLGIGSRIRFLGYRRDPKDAYFAADFLLHPTFYDPCSLVVLEALACGLPVVTSRYNGAAELLTPPTNGLVVSDPHDAAELGAVVRSMLDPEYRAAAARTARAAAAGWTFEHHYRALCDLLATVRAAKRAA
jgi:UDP-glucose:(heptosyl)LPS alpha-1,3-glucosyltransferase